MAPDLDTFKREFNGGKTHHKSWLDATSVLFGSCTVSRRCLWTFGDDVVMSLSKFQVAKLHQGKCAFLVNEPISSTLPGFIAAHEECRKLFVSVFL